MLRRILILGVIGTFALSCLAICAEADDNLARKDKRTFRKLLSERNTAYQRYFAALKEAKDQVKKDDQVDFGTQNAILRLRQEKDSIETRLLTIALRYGWEIPDFSTDNKEEKERNNTKELERIFGPAKSLINAEFKKEAEDFATYLTLPTQKVNLESLPQKK